MFEIELKKIVRITDSYDFKVRKGVGGNVQIWMSIPIS